ncbi:hypothetical protein LEP1GSC088_4649 [Leptospira interrogans str. L1207]|nr:hypothetical protein LEP1GSC088_4649 [Leptospira interrogans str. L1207]
MADVSGDGFADVIGGAPYFIQVGNPNVNRQGRIIALFSAGAGGMGNVTLGAAHRSITGLNAADGRV